MSRVNWNYVKTSINLYEFYLSRVRVFRVKSMSRAVHDTYIFIDYDKLK